MSQSSFITQIAKSRVNILNILEERGFDVSDYINESISQIHIMYQNNQLDMLVEKKENNKKAYIKYYLGKNLRLNNIMDFIEDLFTLDNVLTKQDDLIIVTRDLANESMVKNLRQLWAQQGYFITVYGIKALQFNILKHDLVPPHRVLSDKEKNSIKEKYNITNDKQIPDISRFSPVALAIGIRPGEMCEIIRPSKTAITSTFYRICSL